MSESISASPVLDEYGVSIIEPVERRLNVCRLSCDAVHVLVRDGQREVQVKLTASQAKHVACLLDPLHSGKMGTMGDARQSGAG